MKVRFPNQNRAHLCHSPARSGGSLREEKEEVEIPPRTAGLPTLTRPPHDEPPSTAARQRPRQPWDAEIQGERTAFQAKRAFFFSFAQTINSSPDEPTGEIRAGLKPSQGVIPLQRLIVGVNFYRKPFSVLTLELQQDFFQHRALLGKTLEFLLQLREASLRLAEHPALKAGEEKQALGYL